MPATATLSIRVSPAVKEKLERLAEGTGRSETFLAGEAIAAYVEHELPIVEGILRGRADVRAGRTIPHEEAVAQIEAKLKARGRQRTKPSR